MGGGTLYVVATPLGHLGDLTPRAADLLRRVPVVAAEDTRHSRKLMSHLGAHPRMVSYHAHSDRKAGQAVLDALGRGEDVALVTDAGTPGVSDPGAALVEEVRAAGFGIVPLPGASAVATALSASGLSADRYVFLGFLPRRGPDRDALLERIRSERWTCVCFEAPGRLQSLLEDLLAVCGPDRRVVAARELTKVHEEFLAGSLEQVVGSLRAREGELKGECTVVIEGAPEAPESATDRRAAPAATRLLALGISRKDVAAVLTEFFDVPRNEAYRLSMESGSR